MSGNLVRRLQSRSGSRKGVDDHNDTSGTPLLQTLFISDDKNTFPNPSDGGKPISLTNIAPSTERISPAHRSDGEKMATYHLATDAPAERNNSL